MNPSCAPTAWTGRCCATTSSNASAPARPTRDPLGKGFHIIQGMIAIGSGGSGAGLHAGTQTHLEFIPERTTDFIFAAFSEEFGLVGNLVLISGFVLLGPAPAGDRRPGHPCSRRLMAGAVAVFFTYAFS